MCLTWTAALATSLQLSTCLPSVCSQCSRLKGCRIRSVLYLSFHLRVNASVCENLCPWTRIPSHRGPCLPPSSLAFFPATAPPSLCFSSWVPSDHRHCPAPSLVFGASLMMIVQSTDHLKPCPPRPFTCLLFFSLHDTVLLFYMYVPHLFNISPIRMTTREYFHGMICTSYYLVHGTVSNSHYYMTGFLA